MLFRASDLQLFAIQTNKELPILTEYWEFRWKTAAILNFGSHSEILLYLFDCIFAHCCLELMIHYDLQF